MADPADAMDPLTTAILLVGFQNEMFSDDGGLRHLVDGSAADAALARTVELVAALQPDRPLVVSTPLVFSERYEELVQPEGLLETIRTGRLYLTGTPGAETVESLKALGERIEEVPGRRGFDAFGNPSLDELLRDAGVNEVVVCGALTTLCVASTARAAYDRGYRVTVVADCCAARTRFEHVLFCETVFPLYASVVDAGDLLERLTPAPGAPR